MLHGREGERGLLAALLTDAQEGRAAALLVRGGAGAGKSALLEDTVHRATQVGAGFHGLRTVGLQAETAFAFAGLHRLLRPVLDLVGTLKGPQAHALQVAFGERHDDRVDPFLVGLATLGLLTEAAETSPVLCLVDDLQWLDAASADALLFAARRLLAEPVAIVFAARDDDPAFVAPSDVPALHLASLDATAVRAVLAEHTGRPVPDHVVADLVARTGGNPLAVVELPTRLSAAHLDGTSPLPGDLPLSERVERVFLERCRALGQGAQALMLLVAADDAVPLSVLRAAARGTGVPDDAFAEVETTGLLRADGDSVQVRHPLVRSAVYQAATSMERRTAHAALAHAVGEEDPERYAWHVAAATDGPDADVADLLDGVGRRTERRRGHLAASSAYERAAQLSTADAARAGRLFLAARNAYAAGRAGRARTLLEQGRPVADDPLVRADIDRLRGRIEVVAGSAVDAHRIFVTAARHVADLDTPRALEMAAAAGVLRSHGVDSGSALDPETLATPPDSEDPVRTRCLKLLLRCTSLDAEDDWGGALAVVGQAREVGLGFEDRDVWANLGNIALHLGDHVTHRSLFTAMLSAARAEGAVMDVLYALNRLGLSQLAAGDWTAVREGAEESMALARSIGQTAQTAVPLAMLTLLAAHQGRPDVDDLLEEAARTASGHRLGVMDAPVDDLLRWGRAVHAGNAGDATQAFHHFDRMHVPALTRLASTARLLAAARAGEGARVLEWTTGLDRFADATRSPWARAAGHFGHALIADTDEASAAHEAAVAEHENAGRPYDAACVRLAYGEHLRRTGRRVEARTHLRKALATFQDLAAEPLVARATQELRASGETARRRDPSTLTQLTPTELQMARLVSQGMTNREVAEQCWVSPRTVAFHLRNVFTKTGITSRAQLAQLDLG